MLNDSKALSDAVEICGTWRERQNSVAAHFSNPWLAQLIELHDIFNHASMTFFRQRGLRAVYLPLTTHSISSPMAPGSDSSPVKVDLFGVPTYLADSMQFLLEYACRFHPGGVFYVLPSFRGESPDDRHLSQFFHAEAEIAGDQDEVMDLVEDYIRALTSAFLSEIDHSVLHQPQRLIRLAESRNAFRRLTLDDALHILARIDGAIEQRDGVAVITPLGERFLLRKFDGEPLWLVGHAAATVPFYQAEMANDPCRTRSADLLMGIGETVGAGERHASAAATRKALERQGIDANDYAWYLEMKEAAPLRTSGFGLGVERFFLWLTGHSDIRDMQMVSRANGQRFLP